VQTDYQIYKTSSGLYFRQVDPYGQWIGSTTSTGSPVIRQKIETKVDPFAAMNLEFEEYCNGVWGNAGFRLVATQNGDNA
jgi:hypothetical protein